MDDHSQKICEPCLPDAPPATDRETEQFLQNQPEWALSADVDFPQISRAFKLKDFTTALTFANAVGALAEAEAEGHHPQIILEYGNLTVKWWSRKIRRVHVNDFILASRTEDLFAALT